MNATHLQDKTVVQIGIGKSCDKLDLQLKATVARSPHSREKGLSKRKKPLGKTEAMLFVFDPPIQPKFWMKDTLIPMSIGYFGLNSELLAHFEMKIEASAKNPELIYESPDLTLAAVEAAPKSFEKQVVKESILCAEPKARRGVLDRAR